MKYLCYIRLIGSESDGYNRYELFFTDKINTIEIIDEDYMPSCLSKDIRIDVNKNVSVHTIMTKIKLSLIQDCCCYSFMHAKLGIVALGYEDIDGYEEYPEDGRLVFKFGESFDDVDNKLHKKNIMMSF